MDETIDYVSPSRHLLAVIAYLAFTFSVVRYSGSLTSGIHLSLCLMGWFMWRFARVHLVGLVPTLIGADLVLGFSVSIIQYDEFLGAAGVAFGSVVLLIGLGILVCISARMGKYWQSQTRHCSGDSVAACGVVVLNSRACAVLARIRHRGQHCRDRAQVSMIEVVRRQLGRVPSEPELGVLLPEPLPSVRWGQLSGPIHYRRTSEEAYELTYIDPSEFMGDIVIYSSDTPEKGCVPHTILRDVVTCRRSWPARHCRIQRRDAMAECRETTVLQEHQSHESRQNGFVVLRAEESEKMGTTGSWHSKTIRTHVWRLRDFRSHHHVGNSRIDERCRTAKRTPDRIR